MGPQIRADSFLNGRPKQLLWIIPLTTGILLFQAMNFLSIATCRKKTDRGNITYISSIDLKKGAFQEHFLPTQNMSPTEEDWFG